MAFLPSRLLNAQGQASAKLGAGLGVISFVGALASALILVSEGTLAFRFLEWGPLSVGIYYDTLSAIILMLVSFLGAVVLRYSRQYMDGDPRQGGFTRWLCLTTGSVLCIVMSGNLVFFAVAWSATSLCLHKLLVFYPDRPGAMLAARKKFIISRLGDLCLLGVVILTYRQFHTWDFQQIFAAIPALSSSLYGAGGGTLTMLCLLIVTTALLKSAQFPFHSWLPDTMETPTPVSALMHAGIINAGGFLIVRLSPLVSLSPTALNTLAVFGAVTAIFASLVMLTHASVKRALAFSTVAQMGFMMLQCGLGAFSLAVLHLVAHSLYKAHAFLSSGSIVNMAKAAWTPPSRGSTRGTGILAGALIVAVGLVFIFSRVVGVGLVEKPGLWLLCSVFMMSLTYMVWNLWRHSMSTMMVAAGALMVAGVGAVYYVLHMVFEQLLGPALPVYAPGRSYVDYGLMLLLLVLFFGILLFQSLIPWWSRRTFFQALYVHARNGFYFNTLANRLTMQFWPVQTRNIKESSYEK